MSFRKCQKIDVYLWAAGSDKKLIWDLRRTYFRTKSLEKRFYDFL